MGSGPGGGDGSVERARTRERFGRGQGVLVDERARHVRRPQRVVGEGAAGGGDRPRAGEDVLLARGATDPGQIGRASCRERGCQYVLILVVAGSLKKKKQ